MWVGLWPADSVHSPSDTVRWENGFWTANSIHPASRGGGRPHRRFLWPTQTYIQKIRQKHFFLSVFTMCSVENTVIYAVFGIKSVQNSGFCSVFKAQGSGIKKFNAVISPNLENTAIYTVFFNFSMCQCRWPTQTYIQKIVQKHCFFAVFLYFSVKNAVIYTFFGLNSVQNTGFLQCFQCSGIQKPFKISLFTVFFHFCPFFPCWKPTKNDPKFRFNTILSSDTKKSSVRNRFWPSPPAKADIATAILTNVIKHLV